MPNWFPWIFVGGILFIALSFLASKYKKVEYRNIQIFQDFISGSILIASIGVLMPDMFPQIEVPVKLPSVLIGGSDDMDIQVGPPRLSGR
jgi:hypothetical protein